MLHKRLSPAAWLGLAIGCPLALAVLMTLLPSPVATLGAAGFYAVLAVTLVVAFAFAAMHWKALDETGRAAHRHAWYWGGSAALGVAVLLAAVTMRNAGLSAWLEDFVASINQEGRVTPVALAFMLGVIFTSLALMAGYILVWFAWWGARRSAD